MIGKMISSIEVSYVETFRVEVDAANGTVVHHEPGPHAAGRLPPGSVEDDEHQMDKETPVAEDGNAMFGLPIPVTVAGDEVRKEFFRPLMAFLLRFKRTAVPPARAVQIVG